MDGPDYPQDDRPETPTNVPALIHDYRAQREAWREQARNLARMREEVLTAADREARDIVSSARADVRRILLKARRDLLVLAAQVRAAGRLGDADDTPETVNLLPADDLGQASHTLTSARHDVRRVLDESRPELEGLASEGEALRAALRQQRPIGPSPDDVRRHMAMPIYEVPAAREAEAPDDFEYTSIETDEAPELTVRAQRPVRAIIAAAATLAGLAVMGTGFWLFRPQGDSPTDGVVPAEQTTSLASPGARPAANAATARTPGSASARSAAVSLNVAVKENSWMRVTVDGRVTAERIFKAGETQQIRAAREVSIRAGNAGAVMVSVGGRQAVALGRDGEVVTRRFASEAPRVQPTAPATPSATPGPNSPAAAPPASSVVSPPTQSATTAAFGPSPRAPEPTPVAPSPAASSTVPPANLNPPAATTATRLPAPAVDRPATLAAPAAAAPQVSLQDSLTTAAVRWLDAYYRQDRATMTAISAQVTVADSRSDKERLPRGFNGVQRSLDSVNFQVEGPEAMLTARMTERMENAAAGQMSQAVSFVSHMWTQRNGVWQMHDVRIMSVSALSKTLR
jgi:hypothetical protein